MHLKLTERKQLGEELEHPVAELGGQVFIGRRHHDLDEFPASGTKWYPGKMSG